jgi:hypothetical protein
MQRPLPALALALLGLLAGLFLSQCFSPTYADCAFRCGTGTPSCPAEYECRPDGYCHLPASTATCVPALDLATATDLGPDSAPAD